MPPIEELSEGYLKPTNPTSGDQFFPAMEENIQRMNDDVAALKEAVGDLAEEIEETAGELQEEIDEIESRLNPLLPVAPIANNVECTWSTNTTIISLSEILDAGTRLRVQVQIALSGTPDSEDLNLFLNLSGSGYEIDTSRILHPDLQVISLPSHALCEANFMEVMVIYESGALVVADGTFNVVSQSSPGSWGVDDYIHLVFELPIKLSE